ncbi:MAG: formylglycine-generating enzyme family protein [Pseudomonadota bacterium]
MLKSQAFLFGVAITSFYCSNASAEQEFSQYRYLVLKDSELLCEKDDQHNFDASIFAELLFNPQILGISIFKAKFGGRIDWKELSLSQDQLKKAEVAGDECPRVIYEFLWNKIIENYIPDGTDIDPPYEAGDILAQECSSCPELVALETSSFTMGTDDKGRLFDLEEFEHVVEIEDFAIGRFEVTVGDFRRFVEATGYEIDAGCVRWSSETAQWIKDEELSYENVVFDQDSTHPAVCVSWFDAQAYISWLNSMVDGEPYRLPTEAEWEYAARAGSYSAYFWGNEFTPIVANCALVAGGTREVGSYPQNYWGIFDTHGNAFEWVQDDWNETHTPLNSMPESKIAVDTERRVVRGGSWDHDERHCRSAYRHADFPHNRTVSLGFRVARSLSEE